MVKIPATKAGLPAITETIAAGINVNVTLIFGLVRYREVREAYLAGLEKKSICWKTSCEYRICGFILHLQN